MLLLAISLGNLTRCDDVVLEFTVRILTLLSANKERARAKKQ